MVKKKNKSARKSLLLFEIRKNQLLEFLKNNKNTYNLIKLLSFIVI